MPVPSRLNLVDTEVDSLCRALIHTIDQQCLNGIHPASGMYRPPTDIVHNNMYMGNNGMYVISGVIPMLITLSLMNN